MKRILSFFLLLAFCFPAFAEPAPEVAPVTPDSFLNDLYNAWAYPEADGALWRIETDLVELADPLWEDIAGHWRQVYLNPSYRLLYYETDDPALLEIPDPSAHAFVVLGFRLRHGEMEPELMLRCRAAAAAARAYPEALVVCTGGATGSSNPEEHTEAGLMSLYLQNACGIDRSRIVTEEKAKSTVENAVNTFRILEDRGIRTFTVVTSGYHSRWAQVLFNAMASFSRRNGKPAEMLGSWCCTVTPGGGYDFLNASLAVYQLRTLLALQGIRLTPREE